MDKDQIAQQIFGKSYAELNVYDQYRVDKAAQSPSVDKNPQIISGKVITRDAEGNIIAEQVPGLEPRVTINNAPSQSASGLSQDQVMALAPTAVPDAAGKLIIPGRQDYYKPIGQDRSGRPIYDYIAAPATASSTQRPNAFQQAIRGEASFQNQLARDSTSAPAPVGTPPASPAAPTYDAQSVGQFYASPDPSRPQNSTQVIYDDFGQPVIARINQGTGGLRDIPLNSSNIQETLNLFGIKPSTNNDINLRAASGARQYVASMLDTPGWSPARLSNDLQYNRDLAASRAEKISGGDLAALASPQPAPFDWTVPSEYALTPEEEQRRIDELAAQGTQGFADGGSVITGGEGYDYGNFSPHLLSRGYTERSSDLPYSYTGQLYANSYRDNPQMVPPWLLPARITSSKFRIPQGGNDKPRYGPGLDIAMQRWTDQRNDPGVLLRDWPNRAAHGPYVPPPPTFTPPPPLPANTMRVGYAPAFADGGTQMLNEPVVGMGIRSGQPKFMAGEAGPEMATFTPVGEPPPQTAPYSQTRTPVQLLDPKRVLMSMKRGK